ncbi:MAG: DEAD/DEAH box helicase family protein [Planctomycetes bacterium]|nr:DEAD/DEAH box helicase family protein [Planctomycetota bacterium]
MKPISIDSARQLIDFSGSLARGSSLLADQQLQGTVAAYNMLARNRIAYLADEVGMGKTYVALGIMGLLRHVQPSARILVLAPRGNIQAKWLKELNNFVRGNWRCDDNCVKSIQGAPARKAIAVENLIHLADALAVCDTHDLFLRMTSFSLATKKARDRKRHADRIVEKLPAIDARFLNANNPEEFQDRFGAALNHAIPKIDLLIVDEAHNLRHGIGKHSSTRNRILSRAFGGAPEPLAKCPWYRPRVRRILLLSATPFEYDYTDIVRQLEVFGLADGKVVDAHGDDPRPIRLLQEPGVSEQIKRETLGRMLIRRVFKITVGNQELTKNLYRREWRNGGYEQHDHPLNLDDTRQRLIVALMQKKVTELLGDQRFNNNYQIGMLSCFESFTETLAHREATQSPSEAEEEAASDEERVFDGDQEATADEKLGLDSNIISRISRSYRQTFNVPLPHPKLDATADDLMAAIDTGEKALVFVRRVATVGELKEKLDLIFNQRLREKMKGALSNELSSEVDRIFRQYEKERGHARPHPSSASSARDDLNVKGVGLDDDRGGTDTFFSWFFRGEGPSGILSGAAFQKNRLSSDSSVYSTFFEEDYVSWLLGRPEDVLSKLAKVTNLSQTDLDDRLRSRAFALFRARTKRKEGYPRYYVFEAYQIAALELLSPLQGAVGQQAKTILDLRFEDSSSEAQPPPAGFPGPEGNIGLDSFVTELVKRPDLCRAIWPDENIEPFAERFRRREQRRELLSAMCRLGVSFIDLYLVAINQFGSFELAERGARSATERPELDLARGFIELLQRQQTQKGLHAYRELSEAAKAFDTLIAVNFHKVQSKSLNEVAEIFGRALQHQVPIAGMNGQVNRRIVGQFRMPGFPLVLVTTDVLQEGEDLHTFCRKVIHYGITWTPSALEQRTGRVDRIGSLLHRQMEGLDSLPVSEDFIQVHYPHLQDTVEVLQIRRVLQRLNTFLRLIHQTQPQPDPGDSKIDVGREMLNPTGDFQQLKEPLKSGFPIQPKWLQGEPLTIRRHLDAKGLLSHFAACWNQFCQRIQVREGSQSNPRIRTGTLTMVGGDVLRTGTPADAQSIRTQQIRLQLRSQAHGDATLLHCVSSVGLLNLDRDENLDELFKLHKKLDQPKICIRYISRRALYEVNIEGDILFHPDTTDFSEVEHLVLRTAKAADYIEETMLGCDAEAFTHDGEEAEHDASD